MANSVKIEEEIGKYVVRASDTQKANYIRYDTGSGYPYLDQGGIRNAELFSSYEKAFKACQIVKGSYPDMALDVFYVPRIIVELVEAKESRDHEYQKELKALKARYGVE